MKKRLFKSVMFIMVLVFIVASVVSCTQQSSDTLVMGTNAEFPPFEYIGDDGQPDGFDVAMVKEIAKRINAELKIENMEFKSLIGSLASGKIDLIAAGMTVTEDRKKEVDFTNTYFEANQMIIIPVDGTIKDALDLDGKVVGVQEGTTGDIIVTEEEEDYTVKEVKRYKKGIDAVMDLVNGRIDAVVIDSNPAKEYVASNEGKIVAIESGMEAEEYAMAIKKDNSALLKKVNDALDKIKQDGTYEKLVKEYIQ
ncbi:MAG: basic amino acid ABC transporter substrate-binding protein [Firmicutes bacterium]|nr:basic amino acid ABC transporter substrate-binding protein [Bacillota bacterium]